MTTGQRPLYGRLTAYGRRLCGCCDLGPSKAKARRRETEQWQREYRDETGSETGSEAA